jgi:ferritin-like metal-binding protein YciE
MRGGGPGRQAIRRRDTASTYSDKSAGARKAAASRSSEEGFWAAAEALETPCGSEDPDRARGDGCAPVAAAAACALRTPGGCAPAAGLPAETARRVTSRHVRCVRLFSTCAERMQARVVFQHLCRRQIHNRQQEFVMAKQPKKLDELFHDTLKDIYYAEKKILSALPKMAKAAQNEDLKAAFEKHEGETAEQVERLEQVFELIEEKPQGKKCPAIDGIVEEGQEIIKEYKGSPALDAGLLSAAQSVEHYEIARYGTLRTWAQEMGLDEAVSLLEQTLEEEKNTDETLTQLAETCVNAEAEAEAA